MQCCYKVTYRTKKRPSEKFEARFSDEREARAFGRAQESAEIELTIGEGKGLIGQYIKGKPTPEFVMREWEFE